MSRKRARLHTIGMVSPPPEAGIHQPKSRSVASRISVGAVLEVGELLEPADLAQGERLDHVGLGLGGGEAEAHVEGERRELGRRELLAAQLQRGAGTRSPAPLGTPASRRRGRSPAPAAGRAGAARGHVGRRSRRSHGGSQDPWEHSSNGEKGCLVGEDSGITPVTPVTSQGVRDNYRSVIRGRLLVHEDYDAVAAAIVRHTDARDQAPRQADRLRGPGRAVAPGPGGLPRPRLRRRRGRRGDRPAGRHRPRRATTPGPPTCATLDERRLRDPDWFQLPVDDRVRRLRRPVRGHPRRRRPAGVVPARPRRRLPPPDAAADAAPGARTTAATRSWTTARSAATSAPSTTCAR